MSKCKPRTWRAWAVVDSDGFLLVNQVHAAVDEWKRVFRMEESPMRVTVTEGWPPKPRKVRMTLRYRGKAKPRLVGGREVEEP